MQTQIHSGNDRLDVENVASAIREGRSLRTAAFCRIVVLDDQLQARHVDLADPVPTARQILQAAGTSLKATIEVTKTTANAVFSSIGIH
jgi:hypothetical protein